MTADIEHRQGCPATGGYGHGVEPCICGAVAEIEMLPLPPKQVLDLHIPSGVRFYGHSNESMQHYARACVAHATAAKDAEIERLRALLLEACDDGDEADADLLATLERARTAEARAERLAEALQKLAAHVRPTCSVLWEEAQAALRDHDESD